MDPAYFQEEQETGFSSKQAFMSLLPLLKPHRTRLLKNLLLLAIATALSIVGPVLIQRAIDVNIKGKDFNGLIVTVVIYMALQLVFLVASYFQRVHLEIIGQDVITCLKQRCFDHVVGLSVAFFDRNPVGRLLSRIESDGESLRMLFTSTVVMLAGDVILIVGMVGIMLYVNWQLTLAVMSLAPFVLVLMYFYQRFTNQRFLDIRKRMADIVANITESLQGMSIIQIFNRQKMAQERLIEANRRKFKIDAVVGVAHTTFFNLIFFSEAVTIALVIFAGAGLVSRQVATTGVLVMFIMYIRRFFEPIHRASDQLYVIQRAVSGARRVFALLSNRQVIAEPEKPVKWERFEDAIVFDNVSLSYNNDDQYAVKNISFEIRKGEKVALVGVTGGGKSTMVSLLLRFYDRTSGTITVDGIDVRDLTTEDLRSKFGLVLQDIFLFPGNVKDNITLEHPGASEEAIRSTARLVSADRFIEKMEKKYETEISERGANLSRGERQLLSFARAMIFNPQVLLLDEATSSVDPHTEKRIQIALKRLLAGRTSLIIAHRLSTILDADKILVIREGEIIERGTHEELLAMGGYYEKLFRLQFQEHQSVKVQ
jgi:ABC-type multidrug transport system fused ATPase/permease subunit